MSSHGRSFGKRKRHVVRALQGESAVPAARIALLAAMAASAVLLLRLGRGFTFTEDEVSYYARLVNRGLQAVQYDQLSLGYLLAPHNQHLMLVSRAIYESLLATAGTHYSWYRVVSVALVLLCVGLFFELVRVRVGPWTALLVSLLLLLCGYAWEVLLWPSDLNTTTALAAGLGALLWLERAQRWREPVACILLVLSVLSLELGLAFVAAVGVLFLAARRFSSLWVALVPAVLYSGWYLWARQFHQLYFGHITNPIDVARAIGEASGAVIGSLIAINPTTGTGHPFVVGHVGWPVLSVLLLGTLLFQIVRGTTRPFFWAALTLVLSYWLLIGLADRPPDSSRYIFAGSVAVLLLGAEALHARRLPPAAVGVVALALAAIAVPRYLDLLEAGRDAKLAESTVDRLEAGAMQLVSVGDPAYVAARDPAVISRGGAFLTPISLAQYRAAAARVGPYGYSAEQLAGLSPDQRDLVDAVLLGAGGLRVSHTPDGTPALCRRLRPVKGSEVVFPIPQRGALIAPASAGTISVRGRLFGPSGLPLSRLRGSRRISLVPSVSGTARPWSGLADGPVDVCPLRRF